MEPTATLLLAHLIADFPLQTDLVYRMKNKSVIGLGLHAVVHVAVTILLVRNALVFWPYWFVLFLAHFLTDWVKLRWKASRQAVGFVLDQIAHLVMIAGLGMVMPQIESILPDVLLYPAVLYAWIPAILMFCWISALDRGNAGVSSRTSWMQNRLLHFSQVAGYPLIIGTFAAVFYHFPTF